MSAHCEASRVSAHIASWGLRALSAGQDAENNWQFDVFGFAEACPGQTLSMLGFHFYKQAGLTKHYQMDEHKLCNYLQRIEAGYDSSNPYHNRCCTRPPAQVTLSH